MTFEKNSFSRYILLIDQISLYGWLPLLLDMLDNMCIVIVWFPDRDAINMENYLRFFIKLYSNMTQKVRIKT